MNVCTCLYTMNVCSRVHECMYACSGCVLMCAWACVCMQWMCAHVCMSVCMHVVDVYSCVYECVYACSRCVCIVCVYACSGCVHECVYAYSRCVLTCAWACLCIQRLELVSPDCSHLILERGSLPEHGVHGSARLAGEWSERSTCFCPSSTGARGVCHCAQPPTQLVWSKCSPRACGRHFSHRASPQPLGQHG